MISGQANIYLVAGALLLSAAMIALTALMRARLPTYRQQDILTGNEREFFGRLTRALPDCLIFPQVAMSALITPTLPARHRSYRAAFARISQKRVDYAIFSRELKLICIVELDDRTHDARSDAVRDALTASAGIKTVRWTSKNKPDEQQIAATIQQLPR